MRIDVLVTLATLMALGCDGEQKAGADGVADTDADADGVEASEDCDDDDPALGAIAHDQDCDAVLTADDCDDGDGQSTVVAEDGDCDGVLTGDDCDDADADSTVIAEDGDCDGALAADDCNDDDSESTLVEEDDDCDGVLTVDDCDDGDASLGSAVDDEDCDGVPTMDDCDDDDGTLGAMALDSDCDGRGDFVADHGGSMLEINAQTFEMGCTEGMEDSLTSGNLCFPSELPVHTVTLTNDFFIGETEVTQAQYWSMMGANPSLLVWDSCPACPVDLVTWHEAADFANAVSDAEGLEQCYLCTGSGESTNCSISGSPYNVYECRGYRLPTEAEWEAAARCGEDTAFAGSTLVGDVAWNEDNSGATPHIVGTLSPNACGLYDMNGNVSEWSQDWFGDYTSTDRIDPVGPTDGSAVPGRVRRGGGFNSTRRVVRVSFRTGGHPGSQTPGQGFRIVRTSP